MDNGGTSGMPVNTSAYESGSVALNGLKSPLYNFSARRGETCPDPFVVFEDVIVFSHLRWDFVFQRPQHLLTRCAKNARVFYVEEPIYNPGTTSAFMVTEPRGENIFVLIPHLPDNLTADDAVSAQRVLLSQTLREREVSHYLLWFYTPMALPFTRQLIGNCAGIVYDCMDELSLFKGAPASLLALEQELFSVADVAFTGGQSLFEHKKKSHANIFPFPSSIDVAHFKRGRTNTSEPADQKSIAGPKIGFFGVIDERMNLEILEGIATAHPEWNLIILGPVVKIDPAELPKNKNIHYLGGKQYADLPNYLGGWDVALLPFAKNESTRFISPTKTPEYLAAGKPVVSTSIRDVVRPYFEENLVSIADTPQDFILAIEKLLHLSDLARTQWLKRVDNFLANRSWDQTWEDMRERVGESLARFT